MTKKTPKLRFKEFSDDWEQRKLGDIYQRNTERNTNLIDYSKTISVATMSFKDEGNGASEDSLSSYKVLRIGDIAFEGHTNKQFRFGRFVVNDIGIGIMSPRFSTLRPIGDLPVNFWKQYIHYEPIMRKVLVNATKAGTMMNELVIPEFLNQTILIPQNDEQKKIGDYFSKLDNLITLHQRKLEKLRGLKKAYLEKMFPKKGTLYPELRFSGFTDAWEQRKLVNCFKERTERCAEGELIAVTINSGVVKASDLNRNNNSSEDKSHYKVVKKNDIAYNTMRMWQGASGYSKYDGILSPAYTVAIPNSEIDSVFFSYMFKRNDLIHEFKINSQGLTSDTWNLKFQMFSNIKVNVPIYEEQKKIGLFFSEIDNHITLHQRKLDKLKQIKSGYLNSMFI